LGIVFLFFLRWFFFLPLFSLPLRPVVPSSDVPSVSVCVWEFQPVSSPHEFRSKVSSSHPPHPLAGGRRASSLARLFYLTGYPKDVSQLLFEVFLFVSFLPAVVSPSGFQSPGWALCIMFPPFRIGVLILTRRCRMKSKEPFHRFALEQTPLLPFRIPGAQKR